MLNAIFYSILDKNALRLLDKINLKKKKKILVNMQGKKITSRFQLAQLVKSLMVV